jgi:hypothetical protein
MSTTIVGGTDWSRIAEQLSEMLERRIAMYLPKSLVEGYTLNPFPDIYNTVDYNSYLYYRDIRGQKSKKERKKRWNFRK